MEKEELFEKVRTDRFTSNVVDLYEQQLRTYQIESLDKLRASIDDQSQVEQKLSNRVFWLNVILGFLTFVGAAAGVIGLIAFISS